MKDAKIKAMTLFCLIVKETEPGTILISDDGVEVTKLDMKSNQTGYVFSKQMSVRREKRKIFE